MQFSFPPISEKENDEASRSPTIHAFERNNDSDMTLQVNATIYTPLT